MRHRRLFGNTCQPVAPVVERQPLPALDLHDVLHSRSAQPADRFLEEPVVKDGIEADLGDRNLGGRRLTVR